MTPEYRPRPPIKKVVLSELKTKCQKDFPDMPEDEALSHVLNNLHTKLPSHSGLDLEEIRARGNPEDLQNLSKDRTKTHLERMGDRATREQRLEQGWSEKYLDNTDIDLLRDVEEVLQEFVNETGIDIDTIKTAVDNRYSKKLPEDTKNIFLPIHIKLRERGYSFRDLF
ncbi:MAG TPA: hypothetical protein DEF59_00475 [Candidatus Magasanikbacteria bacterium]|nr:hypothetical protein [Candidatus Magasanikbacteria bacterium]